MLPIYGDVVSFQASTNSSDPFNFLTFAKWRGGTRRKNMKIQNLIYTVQKICIAVDERKRAKGNYNTFAHIVNASITGVFELFFVYTPE